MSTNRIRQISALGLLAMAPTFFVSSAVRALDTSSRSPDIRWPADISPDSATSFAHNEILVAAPCSAVWSALIEAGRWPQWYPNSSDVHIAGGGDTLAAGSQFSWHTNGHDTTSTVAEFEAPTRLAWYGRRPGNLTYHPWLLQAQTTGCRVITEEASRADKPAPAADPGALPAAHNLWLERLKARAEHP